MVVWMRVGVLVFFIKLFHGHLQVASSSFFLALVHWKTCLDLIKEFLVNRIRESNFEKDKEISILV